MAIEPLKPPNPRSASTIAVDWVRDHRLRLLKFAGVGVSGIFVNLLLANLAHFLFLPPFFSGDSLFVTANIVGIVGSVFTNFLLNDRWTWGDREKGGRVQWLRRLVKYYITASGAGVVQVITAWLSLTFLWSTLDLYLFGYEASPSLSILTGIGCAMVINFAASHLWAFRDSSPQDPY